VITRAYRIYFGKDRNAAIVLLVGGDKQSQTKDIAKAQGFWRDYMEVKRHGKEK
jgi:putative addiction module killer protein